MSTPSPVTGFILAGGNSRRMGRDKATLEWHGQTLLQHMTDKLDQVCDHVYVVGRGALPDVVPGIGPVGGLATALRVTNTNTNLIVAVDLPLLTKDFLNYFKEYCIRSQRPAIACKTETGFALCLGLNLSARTAVDEYIERGARSVHGLLNEMDCEVLDSDRLIAAGFSLKMFANLNTSADYVSLNRDNS